jgi:hypothetical protein
MDQQASIGAVPREGKHMKRRIAIRGNIADRLRSQRIASHRARSRMTEAVCGVNPHGARGSLNGQADILLSVQHPHVETWTLVFRL